MRVLIYGGREFANKSNPEYKEQWRKGYNFIEKVAHELFPRTEVDEFGNYLYDVCIVSGEAAGADTLGTDWAIINWADYSGFPADWETHGRSAGYIRNQQMLDSGIDLAIQFPGGRGTGDMRKRLDKAGVRVIEYEEKDEKFIDT